MKIKKCVTCKKQKPIFIYDNCYECEGERNKQILLKQLRQEGGSFTMPEIKHRSFVLCKNREPKLWSKIAKDEEDGKQVILCFDYYKGEQVLLGYYARELYKRLTT